MKRNGMKAVLMAVLPLALILLCGCSPFSRTLDESIYDREEMAELAKQVILYMAEDNYQPILDMVNDTVTDSITEDVLINANEKMRLKGGYFVQFGNVNVTGDRGDEEALCKVTVVAQHNKRSFTYTIVFNTEKKIVSLYLI